jgi:hypothetical protein
LNLHLHSNRGLKKLNRSWIEKYFVMEPVDEEVVSNPEEHILHDGGTILFAAIMTRLWEQLP